MSRAKHYSPLEEKLNVYSHAFGLVLSIIGLVLLATHKNINTHLELFSFTIFGLSLIASYAASTFYHHATNPSKRRKLRVLDHSAIYLLIAGTYTPFTLITLNSQLGWTIFFITWGMAAVGISIKIFFTGRFTIASTLMYVFMGWIVVFAYQELQIQLVAEGLNWLIYGGLAYTVGAILYAIKRIKYNHAIFHAFVLIGSACHFIAIYFYVLKPF